MKTKKREAKCFPLFRCNRLDGAPRKRPRAAHGCIGHHHRRSSAGQRDERATVMESAGFSQATSYPSQARALPQRNMSAARPFSPHGSQFRSDHQRVRLSQTLLSGRAHTEHRYAQACEKINGIDADAGSAKIPPCSPPLGRPRSDTAFAQGEAVPSSNAPDRCAILIAHTVGLPDVGLTLQTSLIYNHIFVNLRRTKYE